MYKKQVALDKFRKNSIIDMQYIEKENLYVSKILEKNMYMDTNFYSKNDFVMFQFLEFMLTNNNYDNILLLDFFQTTYLIFLFTSIFGFITYIAYLTCGLSYINNSKRRFFLFYLPASFKGSSQLPCRMRA